MSLLNIEQTLNRIDNDRKRLKELYELAVTELPKWREKVQTAFDEGDMKLIKKTSHSYKGSSATIGAENLYNLFFRMDQAAKEEDMESLKTMYTQEFEETLLATITALEEYIASA